MPGSIHPQRLVGVHAVAARYGLTVKNVRNATAARTLPHYKIGRLVRYDLDELDAHFDACRVAAREVVR